MLNMEIEDWGKFVERDAMGSFLDTSGRPATFDELLRSAPAGVAELIAPDALDRRFVASQAGLDRVRAAIRDAQLDALIVVGDDQKELYHEDNLPSILVYYGSTIRNVPRHLVKPNKVAWFQRARGGYYEAEGMRDYPVDAGLARHLIAALVEQEFDISTSDRLPDGEGEGHAFGFIHKQVLGADIPIVPVALNTYYPPNQPTPRRCYALGRAIRTAVESYPEDKRVGIIASGGLSHFVVDEDLDRGLIEAMRRKDPDALCGIDRTRINSGSSEIRNWICAAGAVEHLQMQWHEYLPCYRTAAGTGTGVAFAEWH
ncbi:extradiol ring-cleavage dioxygenase [Sphingomonas sp. C8-2]|nr:extradiol ring-cleavage dioxygenase [Sphingomonas sp. C8-2]